MWIWAKDSTSSFDVVQFSRRFSKKNPMSALRLHISADNRYKLYFDGKLVGIGPQQGALANWFFDTYDLIPNSSRDDHVLTVIAWHDRDTAPSAQISAQAGLFIAEENLDSKTMTPPSSWKARHWKKTQVLSVPEEAINAGPGFNATGFTLDELVPDEKTFEKDFKFVKFIGRAKNHRQGNPVLRLPWQLRPRTIPALVAKICEIGQCRRIIVNGHTEYSGQIGGQINQLTHNLTSEMNAIISIPPHSHYRFLIDSKLLTVGYPIIQTSKGSGSVISLTCQEALQSKADDISSKANRDEIKDRMLVGLVDRFCPDGRDNLIFEPFWYRCWRYIEFDIITAEEPLDIHGLKYRLTGYPLELNAEFEADDWFNRLIEPGLRTLRLCAGETFMDCPYYEQLQYEGDFLIQSLLTYVLSGDDRLPRQAIEAFSQSRLTNGLTQSRYPCRFPQIIPVFSLLHIVTLNDFLMWRGDVEFVRKQFDSVDSILHAYKQFVKTNGLIGKLPGMLFVDWPKCSTWKAGAPPGATEGNSFLMSFFYLYALQKATSLNKNIGNISIAEEISHQADMLQAILRKEAFDKSEQVFVDEPSGQYLSQHTNILAILTNAYQGIVDGQILLDRILKDKRMVQATCYFSYYLFEAMYHVGRADLIWPALKPWHKMLDNGLSTFSETDEPTRSDCHGWSAHPLYHFFASVLGVRPTAPGCSQISIKPAPVPKKTGSSSPLPTVLGGAFMAPRGKCHIRIEAGEHSWRVHTKLPSGMELQSE